jgi:predicted nucleic acid-binding protein
MNNDPNGRRRLRRFGHRDGRRSEPKKRLTPISAASETSGMSNEATPPIIYIDANPFIYFIDGQEDVADRVRPFFALLSERPGIAITSELTLAEVLARAGPDARRDYFNLIVWSNLFQLHPVTRDILIDTADYRRVNRKSRPDGTKVTVKLPDAIHVVTAARSRCRMILSSDEGLVVPVGIAILKPNEVGLSEFVRELA